MVAIFLIIMTFINITHEIAGSSGGEKPKEGEASPAPKKPAVKDLLQQAAGLSGKGDYNGALKIYNDILTLDTNNGVVYFGMALCYENLKDYEKAIYGRNS
jgi:tetratricopeptide (TPR) repeat protein